MQTNTKVVNDWEPVIRDLLKTVTDAGFVLKYVDNGDGKEIAEDIDTATKLINATDESHVFIQWPDGKVRYLWVVLGNEPYEMVADYSMPNWPATDLMDPVLDVFSKKWEDRSVPSKQVAC